MELGPRGMRLFLNWYPPYLFTRTRVKSISKDWRSCVVELKKSFLTRNYVGTTFGGSLFAATDPFLMLMLIKILGIEDYIIWDKAAIATFKPKARPCRNSRYGESTAMVKPASRFARRSISSEKPRPNRSRLNPRTKIVKKLQ
ncbi:MAG: DUF4442 domain-containing protein [Deltaproteobacteria bacterium]|nr:DUF4442 domain-containing protein [Deltaproteobacteria bacterium]